MANTEKNLATIRAQHLGFLVFGIVAVVMIILGIVLGLTGVFTSGGAACFAVLGGIFGGTAVGILTGSTFYVINMWNSTYWGTS